MRWLYRIQTRMGLSRPEGTAGLVLLAALLGGTIARHLQATSAPVPADLYAAADAAFVTAAADTSGDTSVAFATPHSSFDATPQDSSADGVEGAATSDSTASEIAGAAVERAAAPRRSGKPPPVPTNVNTASEAELQRLPRIGPALAGRIVEYRRLNGPFRNAEQLAEVRGIGEKTLEKLRPWVRW